MPELFVKKLSVVDFSYLDSARGLVGESWQLDIALRGNLDAQGMLLDFGEVKRQVKRLVDEQFDHKLLVAAQDPCLTVSQLDQALHLSYETEIGERIQHQSPNQAVTLIEGSRIDPQSLAKAIKQKLAQHLPDNVESLQVQLWPEPSSGAFYHYSHGLKHHGGNCQRIAHGHRSSLQIERNGQRDPALEQQWADAWRDIYIGSREDLVAESDLELSFAYQSAQGGFALTLPRRRCYLIDSDSTVENIAQHIADNLSQRHPGEQFRVTAYEGIDKGAIGTGSV